MIDTLYIKCQMFNVLRLNISDQIG